MEGDIMYHARDQPQLGSSRERPISEVSYICSIIRITLADGDVGAEREREGKLRYRIELLAPSAGLFTLVSTDLQSCSTFDVNPITLSSA